MDGRAGEQHATTCLQRPEGHRRLGVLVLEPVSLVADQQTALVALLEELLVDTEGFVRDDEHGRARVREALDHRLNLFLAGLAHADHVDAARLQPIRADPLLVQLALPVGHQRDGARHDRMRYGGLAVRSHALRHERPQNRDRLQRLAEAHVVGQNAAAPRVLAETHEAVE